MKNPSIWSANDKMVVWKSRHSGRWAADLATKSGRLDVDLGWFPTHAQALRAAVEWAEAQRAA